MVSLCGLPQNQHDIGNRAFILQKENLVGQVLLQFPVMLHVFPCLHKSRYGLRQGQVEGLFPKDGTDKADNKEYAEGFHLCKYKNHSGKPLAMAQP